MWQGNKGLEAQPNVVPGSDGAGVVVAIGQSVTTFKPGDKVVASLTIKMGEDEKPMFANTAAGLGQSEDGTLAEYCILDESDVISMPPKISFEEACTLTCSALTAWNALFGGKGLKKGDYVLTQGTGGVSVAALQVSAAVPRYHSTALKAVI